MKNKISNSGGKITGRFWIVILKRPIEFLRKYWNWSTKGSEKSFHQNGTHAVIDRCPLCGDKIPVEFLIFGDFACDCGQKIVRPYGAINIFEFEERP
jgi:hypothetical protein